MDRAIDIDAATGQSSVECVDRRNFNAAILVHAQHHIVCFKGLLH